MRNFPFSYVYDMCSRASCVVFPLPNSIFYMISWRMSWCWIHVDWLNLFMSVWLEEFSSFLVSSYFQRLCGWRWTGLWVPWQLSLCNFVKKPKRAYSNLSKFDIQRINFRRRFQYSCYTQSIPSCFTFYIKIQLRILSIFD